MAAKKKTSVRGKRPASVPKGYHRMPDGSLMKGASHKAAPAKKTTSKSVRRQNMDY
jgi:hypothetical protein